MKRIEAYQKVFGTAEGLLVLDDLMAQHAMMGSTFGDDIHKMILREGERNVVLRILKLLNLNPNDLRERIADYERETAEQSV